MDDDNEQMGIGQGAPPPGLLGPSMEAEEKALKGGKGRMLAGMIAAVVAVVAALGFYLGSGDDEQYTSFGQKVNGYDQEYFDQFWACTLDGADLREVRSDTDLRQHINRRTTAGKERYVRHVRDDCLPKLADLGPKLESLIPPEELGGHIRDMGEALRRLRGAMSDFIAHVEGLEEAYDPDAAADQLTRIARAWYDYRRVLGEFNTELRKILGR